MALSMTGQQITPETIKEAERGMDEAAVALFELFASRPKRPTSSWRWHHRQYVPVQREDGSIAFIPDPDIAEIEAMLDEVLGPKHELEDG